jgi:tetratricopeptide (TPR) repeat protein
MPTTLGDITMHTCRKIAALTLSVLFLSVAAVGQNSGRLLVRTRWADDSQASLQGLSVTLSTATGIPMGQTFTDDSGGANFEMVQPGNYMLKVSGANVAETVITDFIVQPNETFHNEIVRVKFKAPGADSPTSLNSSVSSSELNIPAKARREFDKGSEALEEEKNDEAMKHFLRAVEIYPKYGMAWNYLGVLAMNKGETASGAELFDKAIDADPQCGPAYVNRAKTLMSKPDIKRAEEDLTKAVALNPTNVPALLLLATAQLKNHEFEQALLNSRKVHSLTHIGFAGVHLVSANALEALKRPAEALQEYKLYLFENPNADNAAEVRSRIDQISRSK